MLLATILASGIMFVMRYDFSFTLLRLTAFFLGVVLPIYTLFITAASAVLFPFVILIVCLTIYLLTKTRYAHCRPQTVDKMSGEEFEQYMRFWFRIHGYRKIRETKTTRDYGADLIMKKGLHTVVVQTKRYDRNIGVSAIQQVSAALDYYNASKAIVATNRYFTTAAIKLAEVNDVVLIDREVLFGIPKNKK